MEENKKRNVAGAMVLTPEDEKRVNGGEMCKEIKLTVTNGSVSYVIDLEFESKSEDGKMGIGITTKGPELENIMNRGDKTVSIVGNLALEAIYEFFTQK